MARPRLQASIAREQVYNEVEEYMVDFIGPDPSAFYWQKRAACRDTDPDIFHPFTESRVPGVRDRYMIATIAAAKKICRGDEATGRPPCPVRLECLGYAMAAHEHHGIWGGMTAAERDALRKQGHKRNQRRVRAAAAAAGRNFEQDFEDSPEA